VTEEQSTAWVGDQVYDAGRGKEGVITDVKGGIFFLREVYMWARTWTAPNADKLEVTMPRLERNKQRQEQGW